MPACPPRPAGTKASSKTTACRATACTCGARRAACTVGRQAGGWLSEGFPSPGGPPGGGFGARTRARRAGETSCKGRWPSTGAWQLWRPPARARVAWRQRLGLGPVNRCPTALTGLLPRQPRRAAWPPALWPRQPPPPSSPPYAPTVQWRSSMMDGCGVKITKQPGTATYLAEEGEFVNDEWVRARAASRSRPQPAGGRVLVHAAAGRARAGCWLL